MTWRGACDETTRRDPIQEVTERIIAEIEKGVLPWKREWDPAKCVGPQSPFNPTTGDFYHGINLICLGLNPHAILTGDPRFCTYKQAHDEGWQVKKGEKATTVFFFKPLMVEDQKTADGTRVVPILRYYAVFHASQIDGIAPYKPPTVEEAPWTRPEAADIILRNCGAALSVGSDRAFYSPKRDLINLPPDVAFPRPEYWAATAIHEINHSTGHESRMNRDLSGLFGTEKYAQEEARVELVAAFVCNTLNLPTDFANHASYIDTWLKKLKSDKRELFHAAADAQKIADWALAYHPDFHAKHADRPRQALPGNVSSISSPTLV